MLIKTLYNLFCGSESQDGRSDCAPDVIEEKERIVIIPEKFIDDIEHIAKYRVGLKYSPQKKRKNIALC